jgi:hypothetical protein
VSFLTRHITNPVYLMEMRRLNRSWIIPITLFITLFFTFIFPVLIYIADFQWNYTGSNPRGARGAFAEKAYELLLMFHMWIPFAWCLLFPLTVAHGYHTPQREFTHHGKLQPKTLLEGVRKAAWTWLGLISLATVPGMIFVIYLAWGDSFISNLVAFMPTFLMINLLLALLVTELGLICVGLGIWGLAVTFIAFTPIWVVLFVLIFRWGWYFLYFFFGIELPADVKPIDLADLPWGPIVGMLIYSITILACAKVTSRMVLQPRASNREAPFRIVLTATVLINLFFAGYLSFTSTGDLISGTSAGDTSSGFQFELLPLLMCPCLSLMGMLPGLGEGTGPLSQRIRRKIPNRKWRRWLAYPFFSGPDSRIIWIAGLLLVGATAGVALGSGHWNGTFGLAFMMMAWYLQIAVLMQNSPGASPEKRTRSLGKFTLTRVVIPFILVMWFIDQSEAYDEMVEKKILFPVGIILFLIQAFRCHKWFLKRWSDFKPAQ